MKAMREAPIHDVFTADGSFAPTDGCSMTAISFA